MQRLRAPDTPPSLARALVGIRCCRPTLVEATPRFQSRRATGLEMVYGKVFVAGGSKGVGRIVIDKLLEQGSEVVALVRREDAKAELEAINGESRPKVIVDYQYVS